jgi:hypothetical protein
MFGQKHFTGHMKKDEPVYPQSRPSAVCNDGFLWHSENLNKTCGHHGGVKQFVGLQFLSADGYEISSAQLVLDNLKREMAGGYKPIGPSTKKVKKSLFPIVKGKP